MKRNFTKKAQKYNKKNESKNSKEYILGAILLNEAKNIKVDFHGKYNKGAYPKIRFYTVSGRMTKEIDFNKTTFIEAPHKKIIVKLYIPQGSRFKVEELTISVSNERVDFISNNFRNKSIVIVPGFPDEDNKYLYAFVYTRVKELKAQGIEVDIASTTITDEYKYYEYDGLKVNVINFFDLRVLLQKRKYEKIIVHFFSPQVSQLLDGVDITESDVFLFAHGADFLYRKKGLFELPYFTSPKEFHSIEEHDRLWLRDNDLKKYSNLPNIKIIFPSKWMREECERENNISISNSAVIPPSIDEETFIYKNKNNAQRKNICIVRKYDNLSTYGIDLNVKAILELSKRDFFDDLEFDIYGDGNYHDILLAPIKKFKNVHIHKKFLTHEEAAEVYASHGIGLFQTRMETFGISAAEAALCGVVPITNNCGAVSDVFSDNSAYVVDSESYIQAADAIERLYKDPTLFDEMSMAAHKQISANYNKKKTIYKEIDLIKTSLPKKDYSKLKAPSKNKLLSISVAAYNVQDFLEHGVKTILDSKYADKVEIIIVNDGSKDKTRNIGESLEKLTTKNGRHIVKFIDKENGGHGSTINSGIENATGKYFKLMDADDYYDTDEFDKLIEVLEGEDSDIVLTNYVEDLVSKNKLNIKRLYKNLIPKHQYILDDLCYEGYGFNEWGPLLSTSTFKTEMLKKADFKISEHCFYVDMELNSIAFMAAKTLTFYPIYLYHYYLGRAEQSVSAQSFIKNCKNHEHVLLRVLSEIYDRIPEDDPKKGYIRKNIILQMAKTHYYITTELMGDRKAFMNIDSVLKKYPEIYNDPFICGRRISIIRRLKGNFCKPMTKVIKTVKMH